MFEVCALKGRGFGGCEQPRSTANQTPFWEGAPALMRGKERFSAPGRR